MNEGTQDVHGLAKSIEHCKSHCYLSMPPKLFPTLNLDLDIQIQYLPATVSYVVYYRNIVNYINMYIVIEGKPL